jgi:hypothetical protein
MKLQATGWKNIFANHVSDVEFISTIHKEFIQLQIRLMKNPAFRNENLTAIRQQRNPLLYCWCFLLCACLIFFPTFVEKTVLSSLNDLLRSFLELQLIY